MLDPFVAADMTNDLARVLSPLFGTALGAKDLASLMQTEADSSQIASVQGGLALFFKEFTKEKQREIMTQLSEVTTVKIGEATPYLSSVFNVHFKGRLKAMYEWLVFALKVQFADLFGGLGAVISQKGIALPAP